MYLLYNATLLRPFQENWDSTRSSDQKQRLSRQITSNAEAYQLYVKGRYHQDKWTGEGWSKSIEFFKQAIDKDPSYSSAYAGMAESYSMLGYWAYIPADQAFPNALAFAKRAITLDDGSAEAHSAMGLASLMTWDWAKADEELGRATELNPNLAFAHTYPSWYLAAVGKLSEAIDQGKIAQELDPLSTYSSTGLVKIYTFQGDYEKASELAKKVLGITPDAGTIYYDLATAYAAQGMYDKAAENVAEGFRLEGRPQQAAAIKESYKQGGFKAMLRKRIEIDKIASSEDYDPYSVAASYAQLGDKDQAFFWLNKAYEARSGILLVKVDDYWNSLRSDSRYADLLRRMGLPR
jgi:tetratricopeptide (TPR) repeat protein